MKSVKTLLSFVIPVAVGLLIAVIIRMFVYVPVTVNGNSMAPNLQDGQKVFSLLPGQIHRGSVIAFDARKEDPGIQKGQKYYIKRVIGVAGDTVESKNGELFVNGKKVDQSFITPQTRNEGTGNWTLETLSSPDSEWKTASSHWIDGSATTVPKDSYFVLGDNRSQSEDSRYFGFIKKEHVLGVTYVYFWNSDRDIINKQWKNFYE